MRPDEEAFEKEIAGWLIERGGYEAGAASNFDAGLGIDTSELAVFIGDTQAEDWNRLVMLHGGSTETAQQAFYARLAAELDKRGTVDVLRRGVIDHGVLIRLAYFRPAHGLTPELVQRYRANRLTVTRQLEYEQGSRKKLDLTLFVNGLPVATAEIKNQLTGQTADDAKVQYRNDRDPRNVTLSRRAVVHFAVDTEQLAQALAGAQARIIITTLQKFPVVMRQGVKLSDRRYAIVVDEAHSSQSGESVIDLKAVIGNASDPDGLAAAEAADVGGGEPPDPVSDALAARARARGKQPNLSFFAFTATPKGNTLNDFGRLNPATGKHEPFHLYTMRQAIEEGFILDVLASYLTYKTYWNIQKAIEDDPAYDTAKAKAAIARFVSLHEHNLAQKAQIIIEHFRQHVQRKIGGQAKAMVVTASRLHAVKYQQALTSYCREHGYDIGVLVAFSGTVAEGEGPDARAWTEANMNGFPDSQTAQVVSFTDVELERDYLFCKALSAFIRPAGTAALDLGSEVELTHLRTEQTFAGSVALDPDTHGEVSTVFAGTGPTPQPDMEPLSKIVSTLNERFGTAWQDADFVGFFGGVADKVVAQTEIQQAAAVNTPENFRLVLARAFEQQVVDQMSVAQEMALKFMDDAGLRDEIISVFLPFIQGRAMAARQEYCPIGELLGPDQESMHLEYKPSLRTLVSGQVSNAQGNADTEDHRGVLQQPRWRDAADRRDGRRSPVRPRG